MKNLFLILFLLPLLVSAQNDFYNDGGAVYIQKGAMMHIEGTLTNGIGGTKGVIRNDGTIEIDGNFINNAGAIFKVYNDTTSKERVVKFTGTGTQLIEGSMDSPDSASFYNLVVDQSSASDSVEIQAPVVLQGSLVFGAANTTTTYNPSSFYTVNNNGGLFKTFDNSLGEFLLDIQNGDTDAITGYPALVINGAPSTNFILTRGLRASANGGLQRKISNSREYVYPVGTIDHGFNASALTFTSIPGGGSLKGKFCDNASSSTGFVGKITQTCIGCYGDGANTPPDNTGFNEYFESNPCNDRLPQWIILGDEIKNHGYWSFASTNTGYQYSIETFPNTFTMLGYYTDTWRTLKYEAGYGADPSTDTSNWEPNIVSSLSNINDLLTYTRNAGCYSGNGIPGGLYTDFSHFRLGLGGGGNALPIELLYLNALPINNQYIQVSWATSLEVNNAGFKVMRSSDGVSFSEIAWVAGHDNSTVTESYSSNDNNVAPGINYYYKLTQVDNNGNSKESEVVTAALIGSNEFTVSDFSPNPAFNATRLFVNTSSAVKVNVKIFDMLGSQMSVQTYQLTVGENELNFNTGTLANATYTAVISTADKVYSKSLVVIKN